MLRLRDSMVKRCSPCWSIGTSHPVWSIIEGPRREYIDGPDGFTLVVPLLVAFSDFGSSAERARESFMHFYRAIK